MLRRLRQHLLRGGDVQGDIALARSLGQQFVRQFGGVGIGVANPQAAPAAVQGQGLARVGPVIPGEARLPRLTWCVGKKAWNQGGGKPGSFFPPTRWM